jgi:hypothetical protein
MIRNRFFGDNKEKLVTTCKLAELHATKHVLNQYRYKKKNLKKNPRPICKIIMLWL